MVNNHNAASGIRGCEMALVSQGFQLNVSLLDNAGDSTTVSYDLRGATYADAAVDAAAIVAALAAVTDGVIVSYRMTEVTEETGTITLPASGVQAEVSASLTMSIAGAGSKKGNIRIPMPKVGVFTSTSGAGANVVDLDATIVTDYAALFTSSGEATISDGENAGILLSGVRVTRAKRGG